MALKLCNLIPFCPSYYFDDGGVIRRSSRESLTYERFGKQMHVDFYYDGSTSYLYYLPKNTNDDERDELVQNLKVYCKRKRYKARMGT
jgi:hypothetical protein